ncbi:cell envelope integrity protein TolA [Pseudohalioglobus sediminis]|uniref:Protein TonB n=1 Tax=Pseudohalioglobus sediminis TaxID=2606449 RepID=A0A5B0WSR6_9GAMM|nr:cell envelope integrity protein TolA [Pseudohalioglobus sediminis]KAA1190110.1 cell envelope integrity protein TolA [Pseudohalioglobus sediminis]
MTTESLYGRPVAPRVVVRPALASLALHGLLVAALTMNWVTTEPEVIKVKPAPKVINARLVDVSEFQPKPKPKPKPKAQAKPKTAAAKPKPVAKPKPKPAPKVVPKPAAKPKPVQPKVEPKPETRITEQELAAITRADLARALDEEEEVLEATATAEEMAASYAALIQQTVTNYWNRPPSARNGMEALLQIQLVPTGEVVSVSVLKSSGNSAFDRSAMNAVEKAGSFPELRNLPTREFEKNFRRFRLLFKPEDLRY